MTLEQFVKKLQPMLKNPNALVLGDGIIHAYTDDRELIAFNVGKSGTKLLFA